MELPFSGESIEHVLNNSRIYAYELEGAQSM